MPSAHGFVTFSPEHVAVLAGTAILALGLILDRRRLSGWDDRLLRVSLASVLLTSEVLSWITTLTQGRIPVPLQLCDLALFVIVVALVSLRLGVCQLAYFWALAGSLQAALTPDLQVGFPNFRWVNFFVAHCGVVLGAIYLAVTGRVRPRITTIAWVWGWTNVYAVMVSLINWRWGTNFGYLAHKPIQPSLLDLFGPWPGYIGAMEVMSLGSFILYYAPFAVAGRFVRSRCGSVVASHEPRILGQ